MSAKDTTVNIRVSAETKARWQEAAGGPRKLSKWLTRLADAAYENSKIDGTSLIGNAIATLRDEDQAHRESRPLPGASAEGDGSSSEARTAEGVGQPAPSVIEQEASAGQCPRWMYHRKGVYCGTCKRVN